MKLKTGGSFFYRWFRSRHLEGAFKIIFEICKDAIQQMNKAQLLMVASSLAYTTILSIIPVLAVSFAIFQAFGGIQKLYSILEPVILSYLAEGTGESVIQTLHGFIENIHTGAVGAGGLVGLIFTSMSLLFSAEKAINRVWNADTSRGIFQRIASYWLFITLGPLALSIAVGIATSSNLPLSYLFPTGTGMFFITIAVFFCIYKWVPHVYVQWPFALISATVTAIFWNFARFGYSLYTQNVVSYHAVYGSLGAIPILLLWIYISWVVILGGAALTAALQKRANPS